MSDAKVDLAVQLLQLQLDAMLENGIDLAGRSVQLYCEIDDAAFRFVDGALNILENQSRKGITIKINSMGGSVYDALAIIGRMKASPCKITTEGYGSVMSAATIILAAGNKRRMSEYALFMWHEHSYDAGGKHSEVKAWVAQFDKEEDQWATIMAKFTARPAEFWKSTGKHTDKFFNAQQLLELGVIDETF